MENFGRRSNLDFPFATTTRSGPTPFGGLIYFFMRWTLMPKKMVYHVTIIRLLRSSQLYDSLASALVIADEWNRDLKLIKTVFR